MRWMANCGTGCLSGLEERVSDLEGLVGFLEMKCEEKGGDRKVKLRLGWSPTAMTLGRSFGGWRPWEQHCAKYMVSSERRYDLLSFSR